MPDSSPTAEARKAASEVLKRVDHMLKNNNLEGALREANHAIELDPRNVYARAYIERINELLNKNVPVVGTPSAQPPPPAAAVPDVQPVVVPPANPPPQEQPEASAPVPEPPLGAPDDAPGILVIDDDTALLELLAASLRYAGFNVATVPTSDDAFQLLQEHTPDLILCDINLETSSMGGFTFFEKVKTLPHLAGIPFIFLTGLSDPLLVLAGKELGADDYLTKPVSEQHLVASIRGRLRRFEQLRALAH